MSASRRTDIPAFYSDWFVNRLREGFVLVRNPFRPHQVSRVSLKPETLDAIVFWTKNAQPMRENLKIVDEMGIPYAFQYTITPYSRDVERDVPDKEEICRNFQELSKKLGKQRVIWRYDPVILNTRFSVSWHTGMFEKMCRVLENYTDTCIFSFADRYAKTERNAKFLAIGAASDHEADLQEEIAGEFSGIASEHGMELKTCCEAGDFSRYGIGQASCIGKKLLANLLDTPFQVKPDRNQRSHCGCVESIDIGAYDTCRHGCVYCYATYSQVRAQQNAERHDARSPLLIGRLTREDTVTDRAVKSIRVSDCQETFSGMIRKAGKVDEV